ncbi:hypothetical protein B0H11DRAFT_2214841 [Mycena galericulata]|nr:hypothetical protein B0H11DRAFT_2214841 [Mycena galericulata]
MHEASGATATARIGSQSQNDPPTSCRHCWDAEHEAAASCVSLVGEDGDGRGLGRFSSHARAGKSERMLIIRATHKTPREEDRPVLPIPHTMHTPPDAAPEVMKQTRALPRARARAPHHLPLPIPPRCHPCSDTHMTPPGERSLLLILTPPRRQTGSALPHY